MSAKIKAVSVSSTPRTVKDAPKPFTFKITPEHIKRAKCGKPGECVVAQAINDALSGFIDGIEVGTTITKIYTSNAVMRYATSSKLRSAVLVYDKTGQWSLPVGEYTLNRPPKSAILGGRPNRWARVSKKKTGGGRDMFKARALPTRRVIKVGALCNV